MKQLRWKANSTAELPQLLTQATLTNSAAIGASTVYHILHEGQEKLAVSLPDGQALIIEVGEKTNLNTRRKKDLHFLK